MGNMPNNPKGDPNRGQQGGQKQSGQPDERKQQGGQPNR